MKRIRILTEDDINYGGDVARICRVLADRGYYATPAQAKELWERYSDGMAAGWMGLPEEDDYVFYCVQPYFTEE